MTFSIRQPALLGLLLAATVAVAGCGGAGGEAAAGTSASDTQDAARVKFRQCMRENGVDIPDTPGQGGGAARAGIPQATLDKARKACAEFQQAAFGDLTPAEQQERQDAFAKFSACMREHDVDVPERTAGGGPPAGGQMPDRNDPKVKAALDACQSLRPQRPGGRGNQ
jgi:hypothetical protein